MPSRRGCDRCGSACSVRSVCITCPCIVRVLEQERLRHVPYAQRVCTYARALGARYGGSDCARLVPCRVRYFGLHLRVHALRVLEQERLRQVAPCA